MKKTFSLLVLALLMAVGVQAETIDLSTQSSSVKTITLNNGDVLTGKMDHDVAIKIAKGATVTFQNVDINGSRAIRPKSSHAGVACHSNATIILKGQNYISGMKGDKPAIFVPKGYTLTIQEGEQGAYLKAQSGWDKNNGSEAPAIGAKRIANPYYPSTSYNPDCGNITIKSGHIVAYGGKYSAAIGAGYGSTCGNIRIEGGKVEAHALKTGAAIGSGCYNIDICNYSLPTYKSKCGNIDIVGGDIYAYSEGASAIGGGDSGDCGNITITGDVTSIYAESGRQDWFSIGKGRPDWEYSTSIGTVTVMGQTYTDGVSTNPYIYPTNVTPQPEIEPEAACATKPTNVSVGNTTDNSATISWGNHETGDIYYIRYYPAANDTYYNEKTTTSNPYVLTGLEANTTYRVYVVHECANGKESEPSNTFEFTTAQKVTPPASAEIYTVFKDGVLTYYYDAKKSTRSGTVEVYNPENPGVRFQSYADQVLEAVIDPSMGAAPLTSTRSMFYGGSERKSRTEYVHYKLTNLTYITGLQYIEMYSVTDATGMFLGLSSLEELDVSMFLMYNVENLTDMFNGCSSLIELNLGPWELWSANRIAGMFSGCTNLRAIYCNKDFSTVTLAITTDDVFDGCTTLEGGQGTKFSTSHTTHEYARPDGGTSRPGYFTAFNCDAPYDINVYDLTANSAKLTWKPGSAFQDAWIITYRRSGDGMNSKSVYVHTPSVTLTNLEPNSTYIVKLEGECGPSMLSMIGQTEFTTADPQGIDEVMSNDALRDAQKILIDGLLYIRVNDHLYDVQGKQLR